MGKGSGELGQIQKTKTSAEIVKPVDDLIIQRTHTEPDMMAQGANKTSSKKQDATGVLKAVASKIPVEVPKKKKEASSKAEQKNELEKTKEELRALHKQLGSAESEAFPMGHSYGNISRTRYERMSASDIEKRAKNAIKRKHNAKVIEKYEKDHKAGNRYKFTHIDKETLARNIETFMHMPEEPYEMDTDEKFLANLDKNIDLCDQTELMKHWIDEAAEKGFLPEGIDMQALQAKITAFAEVRRYIDIQKSLMKNPYYQYMAKKDMSYTDRQLKRIHETAKNEALKSYLSNIMELRSLHFVRSKGMKSVSGYAKAEGLRQTKIMNERSEKRAVINRMATCAINYAGNSRFTDKNYDAKFSPAAFKESLKSFRAMNINNLHYGSVADIATHYEENQYMFDRMHEFEHMLFMAVQNGLAPSDDELIDLRARIEAFTMAEKMITSAQARLLDKSDEILKNKTYKEFSQDVYNLVLSDKTNVEGKLPPAFGCDLTKYMKNISKRMKREHQNREKSIRVIYALTHPVESKEVVDGAESTVLSAGEITGEELERRMREYQKNACITGYLHHAEDYLQNVNGARLASIARVHARKTGRNVFTQFGRSLLPYLEGKSATEVTKVIDIMQTGTDEEKETLWKSIAQEAFDTDISALDSRDPKVMLSNAAYGLRINKIVANLYGSGNDFSKYVRDRKLLSEYEARYNSGCDNSYLSAYAQASGASASAALMHEDWFVKGDETIRDFLELIDKTGVSTKHLYIGDTEYTFSEAEFKRLERVPERISFMASVSKSLLHKERAKKGIRNTSSIAYFEELKMSKVLSSVSDAERKEIAGFLKKYSGEYDASVRTMIADIEKEIKKTDPGFVPKNGSRYRFIADMAILDKKGDKKKTEKSTRIYNALIRDRDKNDQASRQEKAYVLEEIFKTIMSFDINRFDYKSYKDIISNPKDDPNRFEECRAVTRLAMEAENYIGIYKELRLAEDVNCRLLDAHMAEIKARCDLLMAAENYFDEKFIDVLESDEVTESKMSIDDILHMTQTEIDEKLAAARTSNNPQKISFWLNIKVLTTSLAGFDIRIPLKNLETRFRMKQGLIGESRVTEIVNTLSGTESVLNDLEIDEDTFTAISENEVLAMYAPGFAEKDLTVSEREAKLFNKKSRLCTKRILADRITGKSRAVKDDMARSRRGILLKNRIAVGDEALGHLCAFMDQNEQTDNYLAEGYADKDKRTEVMDILTMDIMSVDLSFKASTDEEFADNSEKLEQISQKAMAYDSLLKANPEYTKRLMNRMPGSTESDLSRVRARLDRMLAISDYYRARKTLMSDTYYILHYNDELSADRDIATNDDQRRVSDLIRLVAFTAQRLSDAGQVHREDAGLDLLLSRAERMGRQNAHLTGRPDLKSVDMDTVNKNNEEIARFVEKSEAYQWSTDEICLRDVNNPCPEARKYYTKAVKNYFEAVNAYSKANRDKYMPELLTPEKQELFEELTELIKGKDGKEVAKPEFRDPVTGEVFKLSTDITRIPMEICLNYAGTMSNEEILDIFEGLLLTYRNDIDMNDDAQRLYAKNRFLDSMGKLFRMEYENMKRFENTYGTLGDEIPFGMFIQSMGSCQKDFILRNRFCQDMANLCHKGAESDSVSEGKTLTTAELLVKYGRITQAEMEDAVNLGPGYYQPLAIFQNTYLQTCKPYAPHESLRTKGVVAKTDLVLMQYTKDHARIKGPKVSPSEARNMWKETLKYRTDENMDGGEVYAGSQKNRLDMYTPAQKKELKAQRKKDVSIFDFYNLHLDEREKDLMARTRNAVGDIDDKLLKTLIAFHPAMLKTDHITKDSGADVPGTDEFYELVRKYAGIGVGKEKKAMARKEAAEGLIKLWDSLFVGAKADLDDIDELMNGRPGEDSESQARENASEIMEGSYLLIEEVRHRMYESLNDISADPEISNMLSDKFNSREFKHHIKHQLRNEIYRKLLTNKFYLDLKDVGSRRRSYPEKMYQEIKKITAQLSEPGNTQFDLDGALQEEEFRNCLEYFGINIAGIPVYSQTFIAVPKQKEEEKPESAGRLKADAMFAEQEKKNLHYELDPIEYQANIKAQDKGPHVAYEKQTGLYCWACVMNGLMNSYAGKKVSDLNMIKNYNLRIPKFEESGISNKAEYDEGVALTGNMSTGLETGNPAIFGDYIFEHLENKKTAVRTAVVGRVEGRLDYCKRRFMETLSKSLEKGPVGLLLGNHFVLVRELQGDVLKVNDSLSDRPDSLKDYDQTVSQLFANVGQQIELVWLEDMTGREDEMAKQFDLNYNAQEGEFAYKNQGDVIADAPGKYNYTQGHNRQTILHKDGIEACVNLFDDVVYNFVYLPKKTQLPQNAENPVNEEEAGQIREEIKEEIEEQIKQEINDEKSADRWGFDDKQKTKALLDKIDAVTGKLDDFIIERVKNRNFAWRNKRELGGTITNRKARATASCLAYLMNYDDEQAWQVYSGLTLDTAEMTKDDKKRRIRAIEKLFESILRFDSTKMNFDSFSEAFSENKVELSAMSFLCHELDSKWMDEYKEYMKDKESGCSLSEEQFKEVYNRWDFFQICGDVLHRYLEISVMKGVTEKMVTDVLKLSRAELENKANEEGQKPETASLYIMALNLKGRFQFGFDIGADAGEVLDKMRKDSGLNKDHTQDAIKALEESFKNPVPIDDDDRQMSEEEKKQVIEKEEREKNEKLLQVEQWYVMPDYEAHALKKQVKSGSKVKETEVKNKTVRINKTKRKEQLKNRENTKGDFRETKLDETYEKELRKNLKTKKINWAEDMKDPEELRKKALTVMDSDPEGYIIRHVLATQMRDIIAKYPDTNPDEVESTVNEYLRRLVEKSQYRFRVGSEAAKLILNGRYFSSTKKNVDSYNTLVKKQYSANTKLTAHQSISFGSLGGDTAKELGAYGGPKDFLAAYGKVSFKLNKEKMKGRVTFMAGNSMGHTKKDYGLIGNTSFYDLKHGRAAYIDNENGEAPDITCCGENLMAIYERARQLKENDWKDMNSAEHEAPHTIVDKPNQIYYEAHFHGQVGAAEIDEATMVMSTREKGPKWNFDRGATWKATVKDIKNNKEIRDMYDFINIINENPEIYGRQGMEELKLTLWDLNGNMVSYDELKEIFG